MCYVNLYAQAAYQLARQHLDDYVFVGLTEYYDITLQTLERLLPKFFEGALHVHHSAKKEVNVYTRFHSYTLV